MTLWANDLEKRKLFSKVEALTNVIGLDLYYRQFVKEFLGRSFYSKPRTSDQYLKQIISNSSKPVIITELQAEPWEKDEKAYFSEETESMSPKILESNVKRAQKLGVKEILLWGFEYWYWRRAKGDNSYFATVKNYLNVVNRKYGN